MPFALGGKAVVYVTAISQETKEFRPQVSARFGGFEGSGITDQDEAIACTRFKNIETFRRVHESNRAFNRRIPRPRLRFRITDFITAKRTWAVRAHNRECLLCSRSQCCREVEPSFKCVSLNFFITSKSLTDANISDRSTRRLREAYQRWRN